MSPPSSGSKNKRRETQQEASRETFHIRPHENVNSNEDSAGGLCTYVVRCTRNFCFFSPTQSVRRELHDSWFLFTD
jgi:hypothetical protein